MNRLKTWIRMTLGFSRGESNAFILLLPLMTIVIFSVPLYRYWSAPAQPDFSSHRQYLDSLTSTWEWEKKKDSVIEKSFHLHPFNPNTASLLQLQSLGLNASIAQRIINYRSKGGTFRIKEDLRKMYGIDSIWYKNALTYINLPDAKPETLLIAKEAFVFKKKERIAFDLNKADTSQLITLNGIGPKLAMRILKYKDKLGGFVLMSQLKEVYGLDTAVISHVEEMTFIDRNFVPVKLSINQSTDKELASHPYLNWKIAKSITAYRFQHGSFKSVDDLVQVKLLDEQTLVRTRPYLTLD